MNANHEEFLAALGRNSAAAGVLVLLVLAAQKLFRKQLAPRWHCALWLLVVARLLPLSFSSDVSIFNLFPLWATGITGPALVKPAAPDSMGLLLAPAALPPNTSENITDPAAAPPPDPMADAPARGFFSRWTWSATLFFVWLAGAMVLGGYVTVMSLSFARSLRHFTRVDDRAVLHVLRECCVHMRLRRAPLVMESPTIRTPALYGLLRPRMLLPLGFTGTYSNEEQRFVFLHELAHLRRRDLLLNWIITGLQIAHWFNPLVWFGFARWRVDREIACDAAALEAAGAENNRAYGQTILRLLQNLTLPTSHPGLVSILEDRRQLQRRMQMIAIFAPAQRSLVAVGLLAILTMVGLTDAQVTSALAPDSPGSGTATARLAAVPRPSAPYVLFLVNGSETMLRDVEAAGRPGEKEGPNYSERGRTYVPEPRAETDEQKRSAPKWLRTSQALEQMLNALPLQTNFHVALFFDESVEAMGGRIDPNGRQAISDTIARLRAVVPHGSANLESAFGFVADALNPPLPERIVLLTDGLPTTSRSLPLSGEITEAQRIRSFEFATKRLPPRLPVHIVLFPSPPGDPRAAGLYWELANATRGRLTSPPTPGTVQRTHLAFVIDTSGSMRDPKTGAPWPAVADAIEATLDAHPLLTGVQFLDGDGRFMLGRSGTGAAGWLPNMPETRDAIRATLRGYNQDTASNPIPGISNAIQFLQDKEAKDIRMGIYVLGDEFNSREPASVVLEQVAALNPRDANGRRPVLINAIGFPTTIRHQFSMGNTGLRFANLMRLLTSEHDGSFIALPNL